MAKTAVSIVSVAPLAALLAWHFEPLDGTAFAFLSAAAWWRIVGPWGDAL